MISFSIGFLLGAISGLLVALAVWALRTPMEGLPCPHPMCRNRLPRQAALGTNGWEDEECSVCLGRVRFKSFYSYVSGTPHAEDRWVRVHVPEAKP